MTNLSDLIERVEAAPGPDRGLFLDIVVALDMRPNWLREQDGFLWVDRSQANPVLRWADARIGQSTGNPGVDDPANFLASLDAAMTLTPEGWCFTVATYWCEGEDRPPFFADCGDLPAIKADKADATIVEAWAETPALALVAAALKARALQEKDHPHA